MAESLHCSPEITTTLLIDYTPTRASLVAIVVKSLLVSAGAIRDVGLIPELGRSPAGRPGNPLQYTCLENSMDRGTRWATFHKVTKNWT